MIVDTMKPALTTLDTAQTRQTIERGVQHFMEDIPWLMKALDDVAKIHPFVSGIDQGSTVYGVTAAHTLL